MSTARKSYLGKVKERPEQSKQVLESLSQKGLVQTYRAVCNALERTRPWRLHCAGKVVEVGAGVVGIAGDLRVRRQATRTTPSTSPSRRTSP